MPELGTYEAFCLDEVCAHVLIHTRDEARRKAEEDVRGKAGSGGRRGVSLDWMKQRQAQWKEAGRYRI